MHAAPLKALTRQSRQNGARDNLPVFLPCFVNVAEYSSKTMAYVETYQMAVEASQRIRIARTPDALTASSGLAILYLWAMFRDSKETTQ